MTRAIATESECERALEALAGVRERTGAQIGDPALSAASEAIGGALARGLRLDGMAARVIVQTGALVGLHAILARFAPGWRSKTLLLCADCNLPVVEANRTGHICKGPSR